MIDVHAEYPLLDKSQLLEVDILPMVGNHDNPVNAQVRFPIISRNRVYTPVRAGNFGNGDVSHIYDSPDQFGHLGIDEDLQDLQSFMADSHSRPTYYSDALISALRRLSDFTMPKDTQVLDPEFMAGIDTKISDRMDELVSVQETRATRLSEYILKRRLFVVALDESTAYPDNKYEHYGAILHGVTVAIDKKSSSVGLEAVYTVARDVHGRLPKGFYLKRGIYAPRRAPKK